MGTVDVSYVPGALTAVAGNQCWALVEVSPGSPAVTRIWQQLGQGAAAEALLAGLVADGLAGTGGFALLVEGAGGEHRLFCRGTVGATVVRETAVRDTAVRDTGVRDPAVRGAVGNGTGAPAPDDRGTPPVGPPLVDRQAAKERIDGAGLLTWREQVIEGADRIFLGEPPADNALRLPATAGVVLAGCVIVDLTNAAARDTVSYDPQQPSGPDQQQPSSYDQQQPSPYDQQQPSPYDHQQPNSYDQQQPSSYDHQQPSPPEPPRPKKSIVLFPDTMTMAHPGSLADQATGAARTMPDGPAGSAGDGDQAPPGSYRTGRAPVTAGFPGVGPGEQPAQYQGPPPSAAPPWQPPSDGAWADGAWPGGPRPGPPLTGPVQPPASAPPTAPPLIDAQPWLSGPGGANPAPPSAASPQSFEPPSGPFAPPSQSFDRPSQSFTPPSQSFDRSSQPFTPPSQSLDPPSQPFASPSQSFDRPSQSFEPPSRSFDPASQPFAPPSPQQQPTRAEPGPGEPDSTVKRGELPDFVLPTTPPDRIGPVVPALLCPSGHVNPPSGATCRRCGAPLPHDPVPVPRPVLGVLRLSLGDVITLDRGVLMGRNPRTDFASPDGFGGVGGEERPHVVKLPSADGDISRTHLRVTLDGWHVLVTDLNSTNGTLVTPPGRDPQQLRPGEPVPIQPGTVVTLAEGIDFRYEVLE